MLIRPLKRTVHIFSIALTLFCSVVFAMTAGKVAPVRMSSEYKASIQLGDKLIDHFEGLSEDGYGGQVWDIAVVGNDWLYFATKEGVLQYNGSDWQIVQFHSDVEPRTVYVDPTSGRVYVGGIHKFGYIYPDGRGVPTYHELSDSLHVPDVLNNIWSIHQAAGILYLQGDTRLMLVNGNRTHTIEAGIKMECSQMIDGTLYIGTENGLRVLAGGRLLPAYNTQALYGQRIRAILPYGQNIIVVTAAGAIYRYDGEVLTPVHTQCADRLEHDVVFCAAINGDSLALGTIGSGIYLVNLTTGAYSHYDEACGLQNNTVLSLAFEGKDALWAGMDNGIDRVDLSESLTELNGRSLGIGAGYAVAEKDNLLYLGTNRGLYALPRPYSVSSRASMRAVEGINGQVWTLQQIGDDLFCLSDRGIFLINGTTAQRIGDLTGTWQIQPFVDDPTLAYVGTYAGLFVLHKGPGGWQVVGKVSGLDDSCYNFVQGNSPRTLWMMRAFTGIRRYDIDTDRLTASLQKTYGPKEGIPDRKTANISRLNDRVCVASSHGLRTYDAHTDRFIEDTALMRLTGRQACTRLLQRGNYIYTLSDRGLTRAPVAGGEAVTLPLSWPKAHPLHESEILFTFNDGRLVLPHLRGFTTFDFDAVAASDSATAGYARINRLSLSSYDDSVVYAANYLGKKYVPHIDYKDNSIKIAYGVGKFGAKKVISYQYRLNDDSWSEPTTAQSKEYTNLCEGRYRFEVRCNLINGRSVTDSVEFVIRAPWYRSIAAYIIYGVLLVIAVFVLYRLETRRVQRKERGIIRQKDNELAGYRQEHERENREMEQQLDDMRREKMQNEIDHKSQEIVNLLINLSAKNEALAEVRNEIEAVRDLLPAKSKAYDRLRLLLSRINKDMTDPDVLQRIEKEFDLLHDNFTKRLRERFPELTSNEVLLCAYLKMNMVTKEIAPLMNISVRGVETMRFRIRHKVGMTRNQTFADFFDKELR